MEHRKYRENPQNAERRESGNEMLLSLWLNGYR